MSADPYDPHTPPALQTGQTAPLPQTTTQPADYEEMTDVPMSAEEEAALCARYEEERKQMENAETVWGSDWPEGPLSAWGCVW